MLTGMDLSRLMSGHAGFPAIDTKTARTRARHRAHNRAEELLKDMLLPCQLRDYEATGQFNVRSINGDLYRLRRTFTRMGTALFPNVRDSRRRLRTAWLKGNDINGDALVAILLNLTTCHRFEDDGFEQIACSSPINEGDFYDAALERWVSCLGLTASDLRDGVKKSLQITAPHSYKGAI